jgi:hypothetical protein
MVLKFIIIFSLFFISTCLDEKSLAIKNTKVIKVQNPYEGYENYSNFIIIYGSSFDTEDDSVITFPTSLAGNSSNVTIGGDIMVALLPSGVADGKISLNVNDQIVESSDIIFSDEKDNITDISSPIVNIDNIIPGIGLNTYDIIFTIIDDSGVILIAKGDGNVLGQTNLGLWVSGTYRMNGLTFDELEAKISVMDIAGHVSSSNIVTLQ